MEREQYKRVGVIQAVNTTTGLFSALASGTAMINATSQSITGSATVTVIASRLPPDVAAFDTNSNGAIERNEAVQAVLAYFSG